MEIIDNNKLILGYQFTENDGLINRVWWPNAWPYNDDEFEIFIDKLLTNHRYWNSQFDKTKESIIDYFKRTNIELHLIHRFSRKYNSYDILNVNVIHNRRYIFPFQLYSSSSWMFLDYWKEHGIYLSEKVKSDCRNGLCKILIYDFAEGHGEFHHVKPFIESQSKIHSIPIDSFVFADCNIITPQLLKSMGTRGFYRNTFETSSVNPLSLGEYENRINFYKNPTQLPYHFICLNRSERRLRMNLANEIFNRWNDKFLWSLNKFDFDEILFTDINAMFNERCDASNWFKRGDVKFTREFYNSLPKKIDIEFEVNDIELKLHLHEQAYINVVTETKFYEKNTIFFSEKIYKPIAAIQPFIVFSTANFLKSLRAEGYKTFHPFINEEYDTIEDDDVRFNTLLNEIDRLSKFTHAEMIHLIKQCSDICIYNYNHWRVNHELDIKSLYFINELKVWANELNFQSTSNVGNDNKSYKRII
jgi:hypothetical protein